MTDQLVRLIPLQDLALVRVRCLRCQVVTELSIDKLSEAFERQACPNCRELFNPCRDFNQFAQLAKAVRVLQTNSAVDLSFVIPVD